MGFLLKDLAREVKGDLIGDGDVTITGLGGVVDVREGELTYVMDESYREKALASKAKAFLVYERLSTDRPQILVENPRLSFAHIANLFLPPPDTPPGLNPLALIHPTATIGEDVSIGPHVVISERAVIGKNCILEAHVYIGPEVVIGDKSHLYQGVVLKRGAQLGQRVVIEANSVIGSQGFGYEKTSRGWVKIPQLGSVIIEDDVEIGSCVTIDGGTTAWTVIGTGTKIDNQVQIGHNVRIGPHTLIVAQVGISGSSTIGEGVILAGQVGVADHVHIGEGATIGGGSGVTKDLPPKAMYSGLPAQDHRRELRCQALVRRLPELKKELSQLKGDIEELKRERRERIEH